MSIRFPLITILFVGLVFLITNNAYSMTQTDSCSDILRNGTFARSNYVENTYLQRILYTYFASSSFAASKRDKVLGMSVPIGEAVMGNLNYSEAQFNAKKQDVQNVTYSQLDQRKELNIALASGDAIIVGAWSACMRDNGGLVLSTRSLTSTLVEINLRYERGRFAENQVKLDDDVVISGGSITGGKSCLKKGKRLKYDSNGCVAYITIGNAWESVALAATDGRSSATAFVPARIEKRVVATSYPFQSSCERKPNEKALGTGPFREEIRLEYDRRCPDRLLTTVFQANINPVFSVRLTPQQIKEGWRFRPDSGKVQLQPVWRQSMNNCAEAYIRVEPYATTYGYHSWGHSRGHSSAHGTICSIEPYVEIEREEWTAIDAKNSRPITHSFATGMGTSPQ